MGSKKMITGKKINKLAVEMNTRNHSLFSGLTENLGGNDEGINPHELLEAALAACTILTVQMYAAKKGIALESTKALVKIVSEGSEVRISRELTFQGDLKPEEKTKLTEIAEKCPIHRLLQSQVIIETSVVD